MIKPAPLAGYIESPIGWLEITSGERGIESARFLDFVPNATDVPANLKECIRHLEEYFRGERRGFSLKLNPQGTDFQRRVWNELMKIPYGETSTYLDIARRLGNSKALRAVGAANGRNPIAVIVPCHRVIGASGKLIGYGGGLWRKEWLLKHEKSVLL